MQPIDQLSSAINKALSIHVDSINTFIFSRVEPLLTFSNYFILEEYTEREWKEIYALHFINTSYDSKVSVIRVHLFKDEVIESDSYLGFFNLRPINEPVMSLSFVYPNFDIFLKMLNGKYKAQHYAIAYKRKVHIRGIELEINTFPFYAQDGVVTRCAHADIIMISKYLRKKWNHKLVKIKDIINEYSFFRKKSIPSQGLLIFQMAEILAGNDIPADVKSYNEYKDDFRELADSYIESSIPIILSFRNHVIVLVGHIIDKKGEKSYIVYDDSGYFFKDLLDQPPHFMRVINWKDIIDCLETSTSSFIIVPEFDKVVVPYAYLKKNFEKYVKGYVEKYLNIESIRFVVVDNSQLKTFLRNNLDEFLFGEEEFRKFIEGNLPHYIWYCAIKGKAKDSGAEICLALCADTTKHLFTLQNMFYPFMITVKKELGLLFNVN